MHNINCTNILVHDGRSKFKSTIFANHDVIASPIYTKIKDNRSIKAATMQKLSTGWKRKADILLEPAENHLFIY